MDQFEEAQKASTSALESEGSAYNENQAFLDSYQAKLNQLSNSWTAFATTMQESFLGSAIVVVSEGLADFTNTTSTVVDTVGILPPLFAIAGGAFLALNSHTRNSIVQNGLLSTSLVRTGDSMTITTGRARLLQQQMYNLTLAGRATTAAMSTMGTVANGVFTFLSRAILPIAGFAALGAGISYVTNKFVENRQETKAVQDEIDSLTKSYKDNETQIEGLVSKYEQLDNQVKSGSLSETDDEYLQTQQKLYELLPSVAESVDEKGQAHLRSADAIRQELGYIKELSRVDAEAFITNFQSKLSDLNKEISNTQNELDEIQNRQDSDYQGIAPIFGLRERAQLEDMANSVIGRRDIEAKLEERKRLFQELGKSYAEYYGVQSSLTDEDVKYIDTLVDKNSKLLDSKKGIKDVETQVKSYIGAVGEIRSVSGDLFDTNRLETMVKYNHDAVAVFNEMSNAMKNGNSDWDQYEDKLSKVGIKSNEVTSIMNLLKTGVDETTGSTLIYSDTSEELVDVEEEKISVIERLIGLNSDHVDSAYELIGAYQLLSQMEGRSQEQNEQLADITSQLADMYPHLVKGKEVHIEAINQEIKVQDILLKATEDLLKGTLTTEQAKTVTTAMQAKKRIDILKQELAAQQEIVRRFNEMSKELADNANTLEQEKLATRAHQRSRQLTEDINLEFPNFEAQIDAVASAIDYHGRASEAAKKANEKLSKEYENSIYVSDKFKSALEALNLELERQEAIQAKFPQHSKEYQSALKNELKLLEQKKKLLQDQAKSLNAQISSGKIQQTGIITQSAPSSSPSTSSVATGGGNGATIWNFFKSKGFSDSIVAGIMGNLRMESNLNPNALNRSSGAFGIAQWLGGRKNSLNSFARSRGSSSSNLSTQLDFLWQELQTTEKRTMNWIKSNPNASASQMAAMFDKLFERSEGTHVPQRQQYANQYLNQFAGSGGSYVPTESSADASRDYAQQLQSVDQAKSELLQLEQDILSIESQMQQVFMDIIDSQLAAFDRVKNHYADDLAKIDLIQRKEISTSNEWIKAQEQKETILAKQVEQEKQAIKFLEDQVKLNKDLTASQKALLEDKLVDRYQELYSLESNLMDERISMAEQIIDSYKKAAEAQKNAAIKVIDDIINGINEEAEEADYAKRLKDAQKDRQELLDEISELSIDDSDWAKKRIAELTKELQEQDESIFDMEDEKARNDRIDNLNEQKEQIETDYENLVNDERKFAQMRSDIINANTAQIKKDLDKYYANIKSNTNLLGKALSENLIDLINQANRYLNGKEYKPIKVAQARNGGLLPHWGNQGKSMVVHEGELITKKQDVKPLLQSMQMSTKLVDALKNMKLPSIVPNIPMPRINQPTLQGAGQSGGINVNVSIGNINGDSNLKSTMEKVAEITIERTFKDVFNGVGAMGGNLRA
ncbi:phage tail tip lysozyme [Cytobacillus gottheilii]|uniref:phage tail tip lysozyme n=1 Tax=Cytobacillus gottheilii TaxID=859144 RepID=UPI00111AE881|nr:phage tail tip lysozyme [Cytobacillus gottheilii]